MSPKKRESQSSGIHEVNNPDFEFEEEEVIDLP
jgi:hypothetical protein